jgi:hypothetical protein
MQGCNEKMRIAQGKQELVRLIDLKNRCCMRDVKLRYSTETSLTIATDREPELEVELEPDTEPP